MEPVIKSTTPPAWMRQLEQCTELLTGARASNICDGLQVAWEVYGARAAREDSGLTAFAYCWRRFGPPWWGCDDQKDLVAYILGTPHPEVYLSLHLSASTLPYAVGYLITKRLETALMLPERDWWTKFAAWGKYAHLQKGEWTEEIHSAAEEALGPCPEMRGSPVVCEAIATALLELLRPVFIRDVAINIFGCVPDNALHRHGEEADCSIYAGHGVPKEAMDARVKEENGE